MGQQLSEELRKNIAEKILSEEKYNDISFLGIGTYNTVYKAKNLENEVVVAKIVISDGTESGKLGLDNEIKASKEVIDLEPSKICRNDISAEEKSQLGKFNDGKIYKQYQKYINKVSCKKNGSIKINDGESYDYVIFETSLTDGDIYKTFGQYLNNPFNELKRMAKHTLKALNILHSQGKVHLDIKPANVLSSKVTSKSGNQKTVYQLADFGTMTTHDAKDINKRGSNAFQAPEQLKNEVSKEHATKIDIYSLGVSLFKIYLMHRHVKKKKTSGSTESTKQLLRKLPTYINKAKKKLFKTSELNFLKLVQEMTNEDPTKRPSAQEALQRPFFKK